MKTQNLKKLIAIIPLIIIASACSNRDFGLPTNNDNFQQIPTFNNKVDILFISDDSASMTTYRQQMALQASAIVTRLNQMGMDYHLAVTSTSVGGGFAGGTFIGSPSYLTNKTSDLANQLATHLSFNVPGSDLERGLLSMTTALSPTNLANNPGFLRSDALLAIIVMSDDEDYSSSGTDIQSYVDFLNSIKTPFASGASSWVLNYIGSTSLNSACSNFINVGTRYINLANASKGISQSICKTDWSVTMNNIHVVISQMMTTYYFPVAPNPASIIVKINNVVQMPDPQNGWSLETSGTGASTKYFIQFHGNGIPSLYSNVSVTFTPAGAN
jgi:hypothetical protein